MLKAEILVFTFSFLTIVEIAVCVYLLRLDDGIKEVSCEGTLEYQQTHTNCIDLKAHINSTTRLVNYPSVIIQQGANNIITKLEEDLKLTNHTFQALKEEQKICVINYIYDYKIQEKAKFCNMLLWLSLVLYSIAIFWMTKRVKILHVNTAGNDPYLFSYGYCMFTLWLKVFSAFAIFLSYCLLKIEELEIYLLNC